MSPRLASDSNISASVARVTALIGFKAALPRSFNQISLRSRDCTGALNPAADSMVEIVCTRSVFAPSGSPRENRSPSSCWITPGSTIVAAG